MSEGEIFYHSRTKQPAELPQVGLKYSKGKRQWYRLPLVLIEPLADVFCVSGTKYPPFNCLLEFDDAELYDSQMRHTADSQIDPLAINEKDKGVYHLAQVAACALIRLHNALHHGGNTNGNEKV